MTSDRIRTRAVFEPLRTYLQRSAVPMLPELELYLADEVYRLWGTIEQSLGPGTDLPYWAFAWSGGLGLARYVLDHPEAVAGRSILDFGSGSGVVAIAAAKARARSVVALDPDPLAREAIRLNAQANAVSISVVGELPTDWPLPGVVLAGDVFYQRDMSKDVLTFLASFEGRGSEILIGDPGREFLPRDHVEVLETYEVPVMQVVEDGDTRLVTVYRLLGNP